MDHCKSEHASKDSGVLWHSVLYLSTAGHKKQGELALLPKNVHESKECGYSSGRESTKGECEQVAKAVACVKGWVQGEHKKQSFKPCQVSTQDPALKAKRSHSAQHSHSRHRPTSHSTLHKKWHHKRFDIRCNAQLSHSSSPQWKPTKAHKELQL